MSERKSWDRFFLDLARQYAGRSRDPSTKCGSVIVTNRKAVISGGYNGFARGSKADVTKMSREEKLKRTVHGELNAIHNAGQDVTGCTLYTVSFDGSFGLPCAGCASSIVQAGITSVVVENTNYPARWAEDIELMVEILRDGGVILRRADSTACIQYMEHL